MPFFRANGILYWYGWHKKKGDSVIDYLLRQETPADYRTVEILTYKAFEKMELPGRTVCDEHFLVHIMRGVPGFVRELDFVAKAGGTVIGNIMYTKSRIIGASETEVLTFGPVSVLPEYQKQGVGAALIRRTLDEAKKLGYKAVFIFGHPSYYPRFGFENAEKYRVTTDAGKNFDAFMALPLYDGALDGISGALHCDPVYEIDQTAREAFDREFFKLI